MVPYSLDAESRIHDQRIHHADAPALRHTPLTRHTPSWKNDPLLRPLASPAPNFYTQLLHPTFTQKVGCSCAARPPPAPAPPPALKLCMPSRSIPPLPALASNLVRWEHLGVSWVSPHQREIGTPPLSWGSGASRPPYGGRGNLVPAWTRRRGCCRG